MHAPPRARPRSAALLLARNEHYVKRAPRPAFDIISYQLDNIIILLIGGEGFLYTYMWPHPLPLTKKQNG